MKAALKAEELQEKQVKLQKVICLLLCTVFPLLTSAATVFRLWQVGILDMLIKEGHYISMLKYSKESFRLFSRLD